MLYQTHTIKVENEFLSLRQMLLISTSVDGYDDYMIVRKLNIPSRFRQLLKPSVRIIETASHENQNINY